MNIPDLFDRAIDEFGKRVSAIRDDQWSNPTPCTEWSVRDVVNHIVEEDLWAPGLLEGKTIDDLGGPGAFGGDQLRDDPKGSWNSASSAVREAVHRDGAMEITTHLSFGDFPGSFYAQQLLADHVIHAWDLARGIGVDDELDPQLVSVVYEGMRPYAETLSQSGAFEPSIDVDEAADVQTRLLALTGRWR